MATTVDNNNTNQRYLGAIGKFSKEEVENANKSSDGYTGSTDNKEKGTEEEGP